MAAEIWGCPLNESTDHDGIYPGDEHCPRCQIERLEAGLTELSRWMEHEGRADLAGTLLLFRDGNIARLTYSKDLDV